LNQPILIDSFPDNRTARAEMRLLVPTGAAGYKPVDPASPLRKTMYYQVRFEMRAMRPAYYGTRAGMPSKQADGTYSVRINAKFPDRVLSGTTLYTPLSTATSVVSYSNTKVYVRLSRSDDSTEGQWVEELFPSISKFEMPSYSHSVADYNVERSSDSDPNPSVIPTQGLISGAVDQFGYVNLVLNGLAPDTNYSTYIIPVAAGSALDVLLANNITDELDIMRALGALTQPMKPARFVTPPASNSESAMSRPIHMWSGSCVEGPGAVWAGVADRNYDLLILNGDLGYNDNLGKFSPDDTGNDEEDFIRNYDRLLRDDDHWNAVTSAGTIATKSDHEVQDAWLDFPIFYPGTVHDWVYTTEENAVLDAVALSALNRARMIVAKSTPTIGSRLVSNQRVVDAFNAFERAFPGFPVGKNPYNRNYAEDWGQVKLIVLNSNPTLFSDGSIEYYKSPMHVQYGNETSPEIQTGKAPSYIPTPAFEFFKKEMLSEKQRLAHREVRPPVTLVVFSDRILPTLPFEIQDLYENRFVQMAQTAYPSATEATARSAYRKSILRARATTSDPFRQQINELKTFLATNNLKNVFFITGDAHNSLAEPIDEARGIYEITTSSTGNYRAAGTIYQYNGAPSAEVDGSVAVGANSFLDIESNAFPSDRREKGYVKVKMMYGETVHAWKKIPLV
jgi:hypothetical protein